QKPFYQRLKAHPRISITALKGSETLDSVGFTLTGTAAEVDQQYLEQIFAARPEMQQISANYSERRSILRPFGSILRPFAITPIAGSIYDLRQQPIFQKRIEF
ncbi:MAG: pyridoxamine 5'-phosphate oxidase family protein, partial [Lactobacillus sp.]|nr:pyridoxamine 5'-phosphate oxidase family protein [Lactobacillus sp.]